MITSEDIDTALEHSQSFKQTRNTLDILIHERIENLFVESSQLYQSGQLTGDRSYGTLVEIISLRRLIDVINSEIRLSDIILQQRFNDAENESE